jgi:hypothetical protein
MNYRILGMQRAQAQKQNETTSGIHAAMMLSAFMGWIIGHLAQAFVRQWD